MWFNQLTDFIVCRKRDLSPIWSGIRLKIVFRTEWQKKKQTNHTDEETEVRNSTFLVFNKPCHILCQMKLKKFSYIQHIPTQPKVNAMITFVPHNNKFSGNEKLNIICSSLASEFVQILKQTDIYVIILCTHVKHKVLTHKFSFFTLSFLIQLYKFWLWSSQYIN